MEENKGTKTEMTEAQAAETQTVESETAKKETVEAETAEAAETETVRNSEPEAENKKAPRGMTSTRNGLFLRTVVGGVILYYAYSILADIGAASTGSRTMLYVFVAVFSVAGLWIVFDSLKRIIKKEYDV